MLQTTATKNYCLNPLWANDLLLYDKESNSLRRKNMELRIKKNDYFDTLATIIDLIRQEKEKTQDEHSKVLRRISDDLFYLQKNYKIVRKKEMEQFLE